MRSWDLLDLDVAEAHELRRAAEAEVHNLRRELAFCARNLEAMLSSPFWRMTWPLRVAASHVSPAFRAAIRARLTFPQSAGVRDPSSSDRQPRDVIESGPACRRTADTAAADGSDPYAGGPAGASPLPILLVPGQIARLTLITETLDDLALAGDGGAALALGGRLAMRNGAVLRIVTRTEPPDCAALDRFLRALHWDKDIELLHSTWEHGRPIPASRSEIMLPTSYATAVSVRAAFHPRRCIYFVGTDHAADLPTEIARWLELLPYPEITQIVVPERLFASVENLLTDFPVFSGALRLPPFTTDEPVVYESLVDQLLLMLKNRKEA